MMVLNFSFDPRVSSRLWICIGTNKTTNFRAIYQKVKSSLSWYLWKISLLSTQNTDFPWKSQFVGLFVQIYFEIKKTNVDHTFILNNSKFDPIIVIYWHLLNLFSLDHHSCFEERKSKYVHHSINADFV